MIQDKRKKMHKIMINEIRKIRDYERWTFYGFSYVFEIKDVRQRLTSAGVKFRTKKTFLKGQLIGYKVYVLER